MESLIQVIFQLCKDCCCKTIPSKKEVATVISRLEREGELKIPQEILDHRRCDGLTSTLAQHIMSAQRGGSELKTWGVILGALKAAREEGKVSAEAGQLLGLGTPDGTRTHGPQLRRLGQAMEEGHRTRGGPAGARERLSAGAKRRRNRQRWLAKWRRLSRPHLVGKKTNNKMKDTGSLVPVPHSLIPRHLIWTRQAAHCSLCQNCVSVP